jgi:hypothetical protein
MGYPASSGVLWHVTEGVAVRPEFAFDFFSSETGNSSPIGGDSSSDGHAVSAGIGSPLYGELGLVYGRGTTEITTSELRRRAFGTRSGVGVVLYF